MAVVFTSWWDVLCGRGSVIMSCWFVWSLSPLCVVVAVVHCCCCALWPAGGVLSAVGGALWSMVGALTSWLVSGALWSVGGMLSSVVVALALWCYIVVCGCLLSLLCACSSWLHGCPLSIMVHCCQ